MTLLRKRCLLHSYSRRGIERLIYLGAPHESKCAAACDVVGRLNARNSPVVLLVSKETPIGLAKTKSCASQR